MSAPIYYPKITGIDGTVIAAPLEVASCEFIDTIFVPGQHRLGELTLRLMNTRARPDLRATYALLQKRQRVELYESPDLLGEPDFAGVLQRSPKDLGGKREWRGNRYEDWLDRNFLGAYERLQGKPDALIRQLLKIYDGNAGFMDDFSDLDDWTASGSHAADYTIVNGVLQRAGTADNPMAPDSYLDSDATYSATDWDDIEISFDAKTDVPGTGSTPYIEIQGPWVDSSTDRFRLQIWAKPYVNDGYYIYIEEGGTGATNTWNRTMLLMQGQWMRVAVRVSMPTSTTRRIVVMINGLEAIDVTQTNATRHSGEVRIWMNGTDAIKSYLDNFIFAPTASVLTPGKIAYDANDLDLEFHGDSQLAALEQICEMLGWEYRIRARAGAGNDIIDMGPDVGVDWSGDMVLGDGNFTLPAAGHKSPINTLNVDDSDEDLATQLTTRGQSNDGALSSFVSVNIAAMRTYGMLQSQYSDSRVQDSAIAKAIGDIVLARRAAGNVSIQGTIVDESGLLQQDPTLGAADLGDFILGGRERFQAGDTVPVKSVDLAIDKVVKFVSITRRSGDPSVDVVFDWHQWRASDDERQLRRQVEMLQRALAQRIDTQPLVFALSGTTPLTLSFNMLGNLYKNVYLNVTSAAWAGNVTFKIDGVDRTSAVFGAANIAANAFASDTTWLIYSGVHTITLTPTSTVTITVAIRPMLYG